jgi:hypothetical protein
MKYLLGVIALVLISSSVTANIILVLPGQSIQAKIDLATPGDTVLISKGHFYERVSFKGKPVLLTSPYFLSLDSNDIIGTIIDGDTLHTPLSASSDTGSVVRFVTGEDSTSILKGVTVMNGVGTQYGTLGRVGGGILCLGNIPPGKPRITSCRFVSNTAAVGSGIFAGDSCRPAIMNCRTIGNDIAARNCTNITITGSNIGGMFDGGLVLSYPSYCNRVWVTLIGDTLASVQGFRGSATITKCLITGNLTGLDWPFVVDSSEIRGHISYSNFNCILCGFQITNSIVSSLSFNRETDNYLTNTLVKGACSGSSLPSGPPALLTIRHCTLLARCVNIHGFLTVDSSIVFVPNDTAFPFPSGYERFKAHCTDIYALGVNGTSGTPISIDTSQIIFKNPYFCDTAAGNYHLMNISPAIPANSPCGALMGAYGEGCSCCVGVTGDVNYNGSVNLADLSSLVSYLTDFGYQPFCLKEADVNASGTVNLADLSSLVSYLTGGGYVLPSCP